MAACEQQNLHCDLSSCEMCGPPFFFFFFKSQVGQVQTIRILWLRLKLQQISCPQLNVLYEVSEYLAGMSSTFV